jgi:hypothetical protein
MTDRDPQPADAPDSVREAIARLAADGYTADFSPRTARVHCGACGLASAPEQTQVDRIYRFEGASNPDDEAIVLGLSCPACGVKGVLVSGYGPSADPDDIDLILALTDHRT